MVDSKKIIKKIAAVLEIFIYFAIASFIIVNLLKKFYTFKVVENIKEYRQNPNSLVVAGMGGMSTKEVFNGIIGQKVTILWQEFLSFLTPVFGGFTFIFKHIQDGINNLRNVLNPIRNFFKASAELFYKNIENVTAGMVYSLHKIRNSMRRSVSGFNLMFHTLEHTKNSIESLYYSPPAENAKNFVEKIDKIFGRAQRFMPSKQIEPITSNQLAFAKEAMLKDPDIVGNVNANNVSKEMCFIYNTPINIIGINNKIIVRNICDVDIGDRLSNGSIVIAKHKFANNGYLFNYYGIYVSGSHLVFEGGIWKRVDETEAAVKTNSKPDYVYSLSTHNNQIVINDILFRDFSETNNRLVNYQVNFKILECLNNNSETIQSYPSKYLEHGFASDTKVIMNDNTIESIENIHIGDILKNNNVVIGKVELYTPLFTLYNYKNYILTSNMKVYEEDNWINIELSKIAKPIKNEGLHRIVNLITQGNIIPVINNDGMEVFRDYLEYDNPEVYREIEELSKNTSE